MSYRNDRDDDFYGRGGGAGGGRYERRGREDDERYESARRDEAVGGRRGGYGREEELDERRYARGGGRGSTGGYEDYGGGRGSGGSGGGGGGGYGREYGGERAFDYRAGWAERRGEDENERMGGARRRGGATRSHVRCRDIMTRDVTVATRDTTLEEVSRMMRDEDTGVIPVVDRTRATDQAANAEAARLSPNVVGGGRLVGLITDRDVVVRALAEGRDARTTLAEEIMTTDIHTAQPNDRVIEAIRKMGDKQVRRIPIVDREGNLRGIISMADVALETEEDRELADALEEISSGSSFWNRIFG